MKSLTRFLSLFLVVILCSASFSACTASPSHTEPGAENTQKSMLYLADDGHVGVMNTNSIRLLQNGSYLESETVKGERVFVTNELQVTLHEGSVPAYYGYDYHSNRIKATNSTNEFVISEDKLAVNYGDEKSFEVSKAEYPNGFEFPVAYVSKEITAIGFKSGNDLVLLSTTDQGKNLSKYSYYSENDIFFGISFFSSTCGYISVGESWGGVDNLLKTTDGCKTIERIELPQLFSSCSPNFVFADENTAFAAKTQSGNDCYAYATYDLFKNGDIYPFEDGGLYFDLPEGFKWEGYFSQPLAPYFDGECGVWPIQVFIEPGGDYCFAYLLSFDGGVNWSLYDPEFLADINREQVNITYDSKISR